MEIRTTDGTYSVTGSGQGIYNTVGASAGILSLLGGNLGNLFGGLGSNSASSDYVSKDEMKMIQDLAAKDSQIALLTADQASEKKMIEVYNQAHSEIAALRDKVEAYRDAQTAINSSQGIVNAQVASNIAVAQNQISDINTTLSNLTKTIIPISNVCPEPMKLYNSWTAPTTSSTTA